MAVLQRFIACVLLYFQVIGTNCCHYAFTNLDNVIGVDWSISLDTVVYTVVVNDVLTSSIADDVELSMESTSTNFQLNESDTHQALVKECLTYGSAYQLTFSIISEGNCISETLTVVTDSATPVYNIASTDFFTTLDTDVPEFFTNAFAIKISNNVIYGGCGSFSCSTKHLNGGTVQLLYDTVNGVFEARKSDIVFGFVYNVEVKCLDSSDLGFITEGHIIVVKLTFWQLTTTTTLTTITTPPTSTSTTITFASLTIPTTTTMTTPTATTPTTTTTTPTTTPTTTTPKTTTTKPTTTTTFTTQPTSTPLPSTSTTSRLTSATPPPTPRTTLFPTQPVSVSLSSTSTTSRLTSLTTLATTLFPTHSTTTHSRSTFSATPATPPFPTQPLSTYSEKQSSSLMPTILVSTDIPSNQSLTQSSLASATANLGQSPEHSFFSDWRNMVSVIIPVAVLTSGCLLGIGYFIHRRMNRKRNIHQLLAT